MNNPSAFPLPDCVHVDGEHYAYPGMTLRDYFAARAMESLCVNRDSFALSDDEISKAAYVMADAMLKAREVVSDE